MLSPLLARFAATPSLVAPEHREWFESCLSAAAAHQRTPEMLVEQTQADDGFWPAADDWRAAYRPYVVSQGVLQIPVKGVLLHAFSFALGNFATGYTYILRAFQRGLADPTVRGIALLCDSPGGHVAGNFDLVDIMFAARGTKPVRAFAHESAYSAAYSIASAADTIVVSRTGGVGSIGVVAAHIDVSGAMEQSGLKVTFIFAGSHKVDGNAYEALPDDVKARMQARIDELYAVFVTTVARNRGLKEQAVRATEALCFGAAEATSNGLADAIGSLDDAVAAFAADLSTTDEEDSMSERNDAASMTAAHETAMREMTARHETELSTARTTAKAEGAAEMQARCKAILGSEEAKGREAQASYLAHETAMSEEQAIGLMKSMPKAEASTGNRFDEAMRKAGNPTVGPDNPGEGAQGGGEADPVARIIANQQALTGAKPKSA